ncbi:prefoldin subunit 5 isoform X1 [Urocitellus parryii]|uniref:prefoldin subunit 5 isoform X1 n=1 Tax=Urocitellus parryii TaxID=9999 RepID=UPI000E560D6B|nr:prefoldin subunit 5 isoform X1 [Urocitellus parryii]
MAQSINITELNLPQLEMLKNQLDQEVEFLSTSIAQLKVVQTKYVEAKDCLNVLNKSNEGKELLVPLTSSMYVPGKLHDVEHVLIDVGTGYYVEKTAEDAKDFFKRKIDFLTKQMEKIQPALQEKHTMKQAPDKDVTLPFFPPRSCHGNDEPEDSAAHSSRGSSGYSQGLRVCCRNGAEGPCFRGLGLCGSDLLVSGEGKDLVFNANKCASWVECWSVLALSKGLVMRWERVIQRVTPFPESDKQR